MRICTLLPVFCHPDWRGWGIARAATDLVMALAQRGHQVTAISPLVDNWQRFAPPRQREYFDGRLRLVYADQAKSTRYGTSRGNMPALLTPLLRQSDVVFIHDFLSPWTDAAAALTRRAGVPYVIHDHGKLMPARIGHRGLAKKLYLHLRGLGLLRNAACLIALTENSAISLRAWQHGLKYQVCPNGLDPAEFERPAPPRPIAEPYILFLGRLAAGKNPELLLRAFAQVSTTITPWKLALVGPDSDGHAHHLESLAGTLGLNGRVLLPGSVTGDSKLGWLKHAGLFALPSDSEGLSIAMLEAMACGAPCLLSPGCNFPEIEQSAAGQVLELSSSCWAEGLQTWCPDGARRQAAGGNARQLFLTSYTLNSVAERLEGILCRAAGFSG